MDTRAILEQLREAHYKASLAVEAGHREGKVELVEAGEALAAEVVDAIRALDRIERAERQRWKAPHLRNADIMLRRRSA